MPVEWQLPTLIAATQSFLVVHQKRTKRKSLGVSLGVFPERVENDSRYFNMV